MRVLFIQFSGLQESIGVASLAASMENAGHKSYLLLMSHCKDLQQEIERIKPGLIAFSVNTGAHREVQELSRFIRQNTGIPAIVGGPHATFFTEDVAASDSFDYICQGEGEIPLLQLIAALEANSPADSIAGLWIRKPDGWLRNGLANLVEDLDSLPMPKRELYYGYSFIRNLNMKRFITGLGCPFSCTFCFNSNLKVLYKGKGKYLRRKSVDRVLAEILYVKRMSALTRVHFSDDLFTLDKKWLQEFADKYPSKVGIPFSCGTRLDCSNDIVDILAAAGCCGVQFGFESGSPRVRRELLGKNWTNEQAADLVAYFKKYGIVTMSMSMIALPGETMEEIHETVEQNWRVGFNFVRVGFYTPYPALELTEKAKQMSLLDVGFSLKTFYPNSLYPEFMKNRMNELMNLSSLFFYAVKLSWLRRFILNHVIKWRARPVFTMLGWVYLLQELIYFQMRLIPAIVYFHNTLGSVWGFRWGGWPATRILGGDIKGITSKKDGGVKECST